jgi:glutamyl-tRNA reductase
MAREILIVGVNHHRAPVEVRERLGFDNGRFDEVLRRLAALPLIEEGAIVSTCNRVEVIATTTDGDRAVESLTDFLAQNESVAREQLARYLSVFRGREAIRHLFRVAASLDSMVVGEPQILGQLKEYYGRAANARTAGTVLHRCFHKSFSVAKRVRSETGVASRAVSVSSAAVELATKIFDTLEGKTAMLIGAGTMGELAARHLLGHGVGRLLIANRTLERAEELARELPGEAVPFADLERHLPEADVVIGSTAADTYVLTPDLLHDVLRHRRYRPVFLIDLSVPRNFDPQLNDMDNVYLYDIDDLGGVAEINRDERSREAEKAETIVDAEVETFWRWLASLDAVPTIVALRERADTIRRVELERTLAAFGPVTPATREALEAMTSAIVNKLLHGPMTRLKQRDRENEAFYLAAVRALFDIEEPDDR